MLGLKQIFYHSIMARQNNPAIKLKMTRNLLSFQNITFPITLVFLDNPKVVYKATQSQLQHNHGCFRQS